MKTIEVKSISFESNHPEVVLQGVVTKGFMQFDTELIITQTDLNRVINQLSKQNESLDIDGLLQAERMYNDEVFYSANLTNNLNRTIHFDDFNHGNELKQIRA